MRLGYSMVFSYKGLLELLSNVHRTARHDRLRILAVEIEKRWNVGNAYGNSDAAQ